jgi:hypothetical protein
MTRLKWRTPFRDTAPTESAPTSEAQRINALNERHREHYSRDGTQPLRGHLVAELPAARFGVETADGVHRIYDRAPAAEGGTVDDVILAKYETEREKRDRAMVADMGMSMPARIAALGRLQRRAQR